MLDWDLGSRAVPNIGGRVIDVFALHQDHSTDIQGVDLPGLIRKLLLFDTVIFKSFGFHEFPHLVRLLGFDGVMELLKSGAIELYCDSTMIGGDFQRSDQPRPSDIYDFGAISIPREQFIHKCLQVIHTIPVTCPPKTSPCEM